MNVGGTKGVLDRFYSLLFHAYPAGFRREHGEEMLGTLADMRDAGDSRGFFRQTASLLRGGHRERWLDSTGGSLALTLRQGLAWGALFILAMRAGSHVAGAAQVAAGFWADRWLPGMATGAIPSWLALEIVLALGCLATFLALGSGRRRLGLGLLGAVVVVSVLRTFLSQTVGYGYNLDMQPPILWSIVQEVILTTVPPLLAILCWPSGFRLTVRPKVWILSLGLAWSLAGVCLQWSGLNGVFEFLFVFHPLRYCGAVLIVFVLSLLSDPRWAVATGLYAASLGWDLVPFLGTDLYLGLAGLALSLVLPVAAVLLYARLRRVARA